MLLTAADVFGKVARGGLRWEPGSKALALAAAETRPTPEEVDTALDWIDAHAEVGGLWSTAEDALAWCSRMGNPNIGAVILAALTLEGARALVDAYDPYPKLNLRLKP